MVHLNVVGVVDFLLLCQHQSAEHVEQVGHVGQLLAFLEHFRHPRRQFPGDHRSVLAQHSGQPDGGLVPLDGHDVGHGVSSPALAAATIEGSGVSGIRWSYRVLGDSSIDLVPRPRSLAPPGHRRPFCSSRSCSRVPSAKRRLVPWRRSSRPCGHSSPRSQVLNGRSRKLGAHRLPTERDHDTRLSLLPGYGLATTVNR